MVLLGYCGQKGSLLGTTARVKKAWKFKALNSWLVFAT